LECFEIELKTPILSKCYFPFWIQSLLLLGKSDPIHEVLPFMAANCVCDVISSIPEFFSTNERLDIGKINTILNRVSSALTISHLPLFRYCHYIMLNLIEQFYLKSEEFIDVIWEYMNRILNLSAPE
jgi:hypothetical protein